MDWQEKLDYALSHTRVLVYPRQTLATFGTTNLHYYYLAEIMDRIDEVRLSEGRITAERPKIITPHYYEKVVMEGFGEDAFEYLQWLRAHENDLRFLEYGFKFSKQMSYQAVLKESLKSAVAKLEKSLKEQPDDLASLVVGTDDFQEISLTKLMVDVIRGSAPANAAEMEQRKLFEEEQGIPREVREGIEEKLREAEADPSKIEALGALLRHYGVFEHYQDRFYNMVRKSTR